MKRFTQHLPPESLWPTKGCCSALVVLSLLLPIGSATAQSVHLPPPGIPPLPQRPLLKITPAPESEGHILSVGNEIRVFRGKLWIIGQNGTNLSIQLAGKTLQEVANAINGQFKEATAVTAYPEYDGRYVANCGPVLLQAGQSVELDPGLGGPAVDAALGAMFGLNSADDGATGRRLFSNAGVLLDLVGQHALHRNLFLRFRLSFAGNDALPVTSQVGEQTMAGGAGDASLTTIVENAERFSLGTNVDFYLVNKSRTKLSVSVEYEIAWNALDSFTLPAIVVNGVVTPMDDLYPPDRIAAVQRTVDRVLPASTVLVGPSVLFPSVSGLAIHALVSFGFTERFTRKVSFDATTLTPDPATLKDATESNLEPIWRVGLGMTLGSAIDIRADAIGPLGSDDDFDPMVRIYLSKEFRLQN